MIDRILEWYEAQHLIVRVLLFLPIILVGVAFSMMLVTGRKEPVGPITRTREKTEAEVEEMRERHEKMIAHLEEETARIEAERAANEEKANDAHEAIDAADGFDAVDRIRQSSR